MGWSKAQLADLCEVFTDGDWIESKSQSSEGVRLIQTGNVGEGKFKNRPDKSRFISEETFDQLKCCEIFEGDCLVSRLPDPVGRSCILPKSEDRMITAVDCTILRFKKDKLIPEFFNYFSQSSIYLNKVESLTSGATRKRISRKNLGLVDIPTPPISEQKRIVDILDQAFADIEQACAKTEQNLKNARELFESYLQQAFSNQIDNCMVRSMSDKTLLTMIDGDRGKNYPKKSEFLSEGHCLFLSTKNVRSDGFLFEQKMFIDEELDSLLRKGKLERNDVVLTTRGTIGNLALYDDTVDYENIRINSGMLILRPNVAEILPSYLFEIMRSEIIRSQIEAKVSGAAQPQLPVNTLNTFTFPVPQLLGDQLKAVELIREAEVTIKKLIRIYNDKLASLGELKKSILQKAFSGELTKTLEGETSKGAVA
ncbi:restriction endonuclease subunit S [Pseudoalteromonas sp. HL-AS1]|uniref:restriction endonuclease subunit S n=1 Tax=Pseudoalteromonas sp. HL-AS1 TaxID=3071081 RepID=UPI0028151616|nr:restriction endonuclease subunit S [Pseudoalteromonas sp. HL-AS1]WMS92494.1 restriction endonuclease subunit S [Pseudoalteromonas sp. HL-AS1]